MFVRVWYVSGEDPGPGCRLSPWSFDIFDNAHSRKPWRHLPSFPRVSPTRRHLSHRLPASFRRGDVCPPLPPSSRVSLTRRCLSSTTISPRVSDAVTFCPPLPLSPCVFLTWRHLSSFTTVSLRVSDVVTFVLLSHRLPACL